MSQTITPLTDRPAWKSLSTHAESIQQTTIKDLFAADPARGEQMSLEAEGLLLDYSKNRITAETLQLLYDLAGQSGLKQHTEAMFTGQKINTTEDRAVLHIALRAPRIGKNHRRR